MRRISVPRSWLLVFVLLGALFTPLAEFDLSRGVAGQEATPEPPLLDADGDGIADEIDTCVYVFNPEQTDSLGFGIGDAC